MYFKFEKVPPRSPIHIVWGIIAIIVVIGSGIFSNLLFLSPPCIFRTLTGIPCLTCGGIHCIVALAQIKPLKAFIHNPLVMIIFLGMMLFSLGWAMAILLRRRLVFELTLSEKRAVRGVMILLIAANWIYLIIMMT